MSIAELRHRMETIPGIPANQRWRLVKGTSVMLEPSVVFILTELQLLDQPWGRGMYVWVGWTASDSDIELEASALESKSSRVDPWTFSFLPDCKSVIYGSYSQFAFQKAAWLRSKSRKAASWEDFTETLAGWQERKKGRKTYRWPAKKAKWETVGYKSIDGVELLDLASARKELLSVRDRIYYKICPTAARLRDRLRDKT